MGHEDRYHAIHADRQIVSSLCVGLDEGNVEVDIGCHALGDLKTVFRIARGGHVDPFTMEHFRTIFNGDQCASTGRGRNDGGGRFTHLVRRFIEREGQHFDAVRVRFVRSTTPFGPIHVNRAARGMSTLAILDIHQIATPFRIVDSEGDHGFAASHRVDCSRRDGDDRCVVEIRGKRLVVMLPPPAPVHFVDLVFQSLAVKRLAIGREGDYLEVVIPIRLKGLTLIEIAQLDADVNGERREWNALSEETRVTSRFKDSASEVGLQHARRIRCRRQVGEEGCFSEITQCAVKKIGRTGGECRCGIVEGVLFVTFELRRHLREGHLHLSF